MRSATALSRMGRFVSFPIAPIVTQGRKCPCLHGMSEVSAIYGYYLGKLGTLPTDRQNRLTQFYVSGPECFAAAERAKRADPYTKLRVWEQNRFGQWTSINQWVI